MNDIGSVNFLLNKPIYYDKFSNHRINGSFIIIDLNTNKTAGVGFLN
jgi:sulfate adenylyltransferase subunit 1